MCLVSGPGHGVKSVRLAVPLALMWVLHRLRPQAAWRPIQSLSGVKT